MLNQRKIQINRFCLRKCFFFKFIFKLILRFEREKKQQEKRFQRVLTSKQAAGQASRINSAAVSNQPVNASNKVPDVEI